MNMGDYEKINVSHRLSSYEVKLPFWHEAHSVRKAFSSWVTGGGLPCYQAYNATKHDRRESFDSATFEQMTDAMDGLILLLSSQFYIYDFGPGDTLLTADEPRDGMESSIGGYFRIRYPTDWPTDQQTDFLVLYVAGKPWEYQQITPLEFGVAFFLTCQAAVMFRDEKYYRAALNAPG